MPHLFLRALLVLTALAVWSGPEARASVLTQATPAPGTTLNANSQTNGIYTLTLVDTPSTIIDTVAGSVKIDRLDSSGSFNLPVGGEPSDTPRYRFTITVNNASEVSGAFHTIGKIQFDLLNGTGGVELGDDVYFSVASAPTNNWGATASFVNNPGHNPVSLIYQSNAGITPTDPDRSMTFEVRVRDITGGSQSSPTGSFTFKITATPEPTSLMLGTLGLVAAGGAGAVRRWRRRHPGSMVQSTGVDSSPSSARS